MAWLKATRVRSRVAGERPLGPGSLPHGWAGRSAEASGIQLLGRPLVSHWCSPCRSPQEQPPQPWPLGLSQGQLSLGNAGVAGSKWEGKPQSISHFICPDWQLQLTFPGSQEWLGGHAGTGQDSSAAGTATH